MSLPKPENLPIEVPELSTPRQIISDLGVSAILGGPSCVGGGVLLEHYVAKADDLHAITATPLALAEVLQYGGFLGTVVGIVSFIGAHTYKRAYTDSEGVERTSYVIGVRREAPLEEET